MRSTAPASLPDQRCISSSSGTSVGISSKDHRCFVTCMDDTCERCVRACLTCGCLRQAKAMISHAQQGLGRVVCRDIVPLCIRCSLPNLNQAHSITHHPPPDHQCCLHCAPSIPPRPPPLLLTRIGFSSPPPAPPPCNHHHHHHHYHGHLHRHNHHHHHLPLPVSLQPPRLPIPRHHPPRRSPLLLHVSLPCCMQKCDVLRLMVSCSAAPLPPPLHAPAVVWSLAAAAHR